MIRFAIPAAAIIALSFATPVLAETTPAPARIGYADLDLSTASGRKMLARRIATVTEARCGSFALADTEAFEKVAACRQQVKSEIAPQVAAIEARAAQQRLAAR